MCTSACPRVEQQRAMPRFLAQYSGYLPRFVFVADKLQSRDNFVTNAKTAVCSIFDKEVTSDQN